MNNTEMCQTNIQTHYDYKSPEHKPPFPNTEKFEIKADVNEEVMRIAIGSQGCHFYRITEDNNIPYIYHDKDTNKIVIWAPIYKAQRVISELNRQLSWARNIIKKNNEKNLTTNI